MLSVTYYCLLLCRGGCWSSWFVGRFILRDLRFRQLVGRFLVPGLPIVNVVNVADGGRGVVSAETRVLDQCDQRDFGFVSRSVADEPRMVLVLACVLA